VVYGDAVAINETLFRQYHVPIPTANWTSAEFLRDAEELTHGSGNSKVYGVATPLNPLDVAQLRRPGLRHRGRGAGHLSERLPVLPLRLRVGDRRDHVHQAAEEEPADGATTGERPTDERLATRREGTPDTGLCALYFHYGRYLLIASSRPGTQPANLQGIWNHQIQPPWSSNWTVNINTQMNYWPAETTNLADCHSSWTTWSKTPAKSWSPVRRPHRKTCSPWPAASRPESARRPPWTSG
jgi:hypothetical protein